MNPATLPRPLSDFDLLRRLAREARAYLPHLAGVLALELLAIPLRLLGPLPLKLAVDSVIGRHALPAPLVAVFPATSEPADWIPWICGLALLIALLSQLQSLAAALLTVLTSQRLVMDFRARLFHHAQHLSLEYHTRKGTADTLYRVQNDATCVEWVFIDGAIPLVRSGLTLITTLWVILSLNWKIGLTALVVSPVLFALTRTTRPLIRSQARGLKVEESRTLRVVQEVLGVLRVVKAFGQEGRETRRFLQASRSVLRGRLRLMLVEGGLGMAIDLVAAAGLAAVLYFGVTDILAGRLTLGVFLLLSTYVGQLYSPLKTLSRKSVTLQTQLAGAERAFALLDEPRDVPEPAHPVRPERICGEVVFEDVSYSYDGVRPVLDRVTFRIAPGESVGIVGLTGAGKTTLTYLLCRFADPASGRILLDGVDLRYFSVADLRRQFAVVLQEPVLFAGSIAENIAYADPDADLPRVEAAARAANIHEFIERLPEGYATVVGERGMSLSGGERQRLGLARAYLRDAPLLILDEPTSSVDVQTEAGILEALEKLAGGRTTLVIAHRQSTLYACDRILRVEDGRVNEVRPEEVESSALN